MKKKVVSNVSWVGAIDWDLKKFHGEDYSIDSGTSQNSYIVEEEKTVLIDTVWTQNRCEFIKNLEKEGLLNKIDMVVMNHAEADHSGAIGCLMKKINVPIYCSLACRKSLEGQYGNKGWDFRVVKTGDEVEIGNQKKLVFLDMKMLHWPDSMATYLTKDEVLFSNDAFGQHLAIEELFSDRADKEILEREALKYFVNILNPFSVLLLKKLEELKNIGLNFSYIAPSHGAIWRNNPNNIVEKYKEWATGNAKNRVTIVYDTMWEGTKKLAKRIAHDIYSRKDVVVKVFDIAKKDKSDIMVEIFNSRAIFVGCPTVSNSITSTMAGFLEYLKQLKFKNKRVGVFGCYGWSGEATKILKERLKGAGFDVSENVISSLWNPSDEDYSKIPLFVDEVL